MKYIESKLIILLLGLSTFVLAQKVDSSNLIPSKSVQKGQTFGEKVGSSPRTQSLNSIQQTVKDGKSSKKITLQGEVTQVCENKGCWIVIKTPKNEKFLVQMKDYGFFVPQDIQGKQVLLEGIAQERQRTKESAKSSDSTQIRILASGIEVVD
ncbi:DUF4920 domain-containing protein [Chryseobacterium sp. A301]